MSARVLPITTAIQNAARIARNLKKLTDPDDIAEHVWDVLCRDGYLNLSRVDATTKANMIVMALSYIKSIIVMRVKAKGRPDDRQFHLWDNLEQVFDIKHQKKDEDGAPVIRDGKPVIEVIQKELAKFTLDDVRQVSEQKDDNIERATAERNIWLRAAGYIEPLLGAHPDWTWKDAVEYMRDGDGLPTLDDDA
jgi:hypothetical protein